MTTCPTCNGTGSTGSTGGCKEYRAQIRCWTCNGTGRDTWDDFMTTKHGANWRNIIWDDHHD